MQCSRITFGSCFCKPILGLLVILLAAFAIQKHYCQVTLGRYITLFGGTLIPLTSLLWISFDDIASGINEPHEILCFAMPFFRGTLKPIAGLLHIRLCHLP